MERAKNKASLPSFFPALLLALVFARAPLSERLEQARVLVFLGGVIHYYKSTVFSIWLVYRALHFHQSNEALSEVLAFFRLLG